MDDADFEGLNRYKWYAHKSKNTYYAGRRIGKNRTFRMHQEICMHQEILGKKPGFITDHIDGDGLNNCRKNLRHVTPRQNRQNLHIKKSSRYPGVHWYKARGQWYAQIRLQGKNYFLGHYANEREAFEAYRRAVKERTGEDVLECVN